VSSSSTGGARYGLPGALWHPVLYGDWHPLLRDPIDLIRLTYLGGAIVAIALGDVAGGARLGATALFVFLARAINVPRPFDLGFTLAMGLQGWGNVFGLFDSLGWWDTVVHFVLSLWTAPLFYIGLARLKVVPDLSEALRSHRAGIFVVTMSLGLAFGACYEVYEWTVDHFFGGDLKIGEADTVGDLTMDALGSALGGALLLVWAEYGWRTIRRVPARRIVGARPGRASSRVVAKRHSTAA
jgi:hypothetical protein